VIPHNEVINPKIVDYEVISRHLNRQFIVNLGISYHDRSCMQGYIEKECSEDDLIDRLTLHSYNDRLAERKSEHHVQNAILVNFVESSLKGIEVYIKALQIVYDQELMQTYLSDHIIPIVADWLGQFFIHKAIVLRLLLNNEIIPPFVMSFLPIMGPLHVSLNSHELVFLKNSVFFNKIYKGIFKANKVLGKTS